MQVPLQSWGPSASDVPIITDLVPVFNNLEEIVLLEVTATSLRQSSVKTGKHLQRETEVMINHGASHTAFPQSLLVPLPVPMGPKSLTVSIVAQSWGDEVGATDRTRGSTANSPRARPRPPQPRASRSQEPLTWPFKCINSQVGTSCWRFKKAF